MRIAINTRFLIHGKLEGLGLYTQQIVDRMVEKHPDHEYFFIFDRPYHSEFIHHPAVTPIVLQPPARHPLLWYIWFEYSIPKFLQKIKADVFFSPDGFCSLKTSTPQCMVVHDLAYLHYPEQVPLTVRTYYRHFVPKQIFKAKSLIAVSEATKLDIKTHFPLLQTDITVAPNGVRNLFKPLDFEKQQLIRNTYSRSKPYFIFVGAIHPRKNVEHLLLAFNQFKSKTGSELLLILVGRKAWSTDSFDKILNTSPFKSDIIWYPYQTGEELANLLAAAHCLILPSYLEGFGVPILEALHCDIPVIVSDRFSLPEVGGPGAYLVNPDSTESICQALEESFQVEDRNHRIALGKSHRTQFSWDISAEHIYDVLLHL